VTVEATPDWVFSDADRAAMAAAIAEARAAAADGDVPVGAVVTNAAGEILAHARNRRVGDADPTAHAEILALRSAAGAQGSWRLDGCTLYVTLEPCAMCAAACVLARLDCVVFGAADPKAGFAGSLANLLEEPRLNHRVAWRAGLGAEEASGLLREFFAKYRDQR
jgi:tRNA(adenine34) deaminase